METDAAAGLSEDGRAGERWVGGREKRARETEGSGDGEGQQQRKGAREDGWADGEDEGMLLDIDELINDDQRNIDDDEGAEWGEEREVEGYVGGAGPAEAGIDAHLWNPSC